jgi:hypothetical protein
MALSYHTNIEESNDNNRGVTKLKLSSPDGKLEVVNGEVK